LPFPLLLFFQCFNFRRWQLMDILRILECKDHLCVIVSSRHLLHDRWSGLSMHHGVKQIN
jgi:hypothetical protein